MHEKMKESEGIKVPAGTETEHKPLEETVSAAPNHGCECEAQPTVDGGHDCGVGHWSGNGKDIKFVKA